MSHGTLLILSLIIISSYPIVWVSAWKKGFKTCSNNLVHRCEKRLMTVREKLEDKEMSNEEYNGVVEATKNFRNDAVECIINMETKGFINSLQ